jgi:hypothetical protein
VRRPATWGRTNGLSSRLSCYRSSASTEVFGPAAIAASDTADVTGHRFADLESECMRASRPPDRDALV